MADKKNLLLLFDRPNEPVFMGKGRKTVFDLPEKFFTDRYKIIGKEVQSRFGDSAEKRIPVREISIPDLRLPMELPRQSQFSLCIPAHRRMAGRLVDIFMGMHTIDDLQSVAVYARDRLNPYLFNYALSVALLHRKDTKVMDLPSFVQSFPDKFVDGQVFRQLREESTIVPEGSRMPITIPQDYTASDLEPEHRLWYFREDLGVNLHHWHWHLVYPFEASDRSIVDKDRRGELFYYMHQQMIARYNVERFCNNLARAHPFNNLREYIKEGYFPKMDSLVASRGLPPRFDYTQMSDVRREQDQINLDISDLERWRDRIYEAISQGYAVDEGGNHVPLNIDVLGNIIESSIISPNRELYGDLHNMGHVFIAYAHDPNHRHLESFGVMGDLATAMRDPAFYKWHAHIDDIFQDHKTRLQPYTPSQLTYDDIYVEGIQVTTEGGNPNVLQTFWQQSDVDLSRGMDFTPRGNVFARFTHLQHIPFTYTINVRNDGGVKRFGMVRIFLGPKKDEAGLDMLFKDQRLLMIELDKFVVALNPGENTIRRRSTESSLTIPFDRTFRDLDTDRPATATDEELEFNFCGCGWPEHMLIPKGLPEGFTCELFVMVSNYDQDRVEQELVGSCSAAASYCGVRDRLYPDRRAMGFPFDRLSGSGADRLENFLTPNMSIVDIVVRHENRTVTRV
ncbi:PREDICTED: phenoloxidase 2-like [Rhagoletis zephyria]|uniref:phenoloxidase 2-like n=1 Tax=Rhagoletis zephyria TaxID=28612 RepID=UPI0008119944|nr:PREDICTED: phenoloxidase 2-like [Rhagoletis zephyria]